MITSTECFLPSCPWYIPQFDTCLKGSVWFKSDGSLFVKLIDGRYPKTVGLPPKPRNAFSFKVYVVEDEKKSKVLKLGESQLGELHEAAHGLRLGIWGEWIGSFSCADLKRDGYVKFGTLVIKYVITVQRKEDDDF